MDRHSFGKSEEVAAVEIGAPPIVKGLFLGTVIRNICSAPESSLFPDKE
jgi:hypothetical protein